MKIDPRVDANWKSLVALERFLTEVISDPRAFCDRADLSSALRSQGSLSKFSFVERGITPSSLNTMKRIAAKYLPGGFASIDSLRMTANTAIEATRKRMARSEKSTKALLQSQIDEYDRKLQLALQDSWLLTMALERSLSQGRRYASQCRDAAVLALCEKEQKEIRAIISLRTNRAGPVQDVRDERE